MSKAEQWSKPVIETELRDFIEPHVQRSINVCPGYWQCPPDSDSHDACGFISSEGIFLSTTVLLGLRNALVYFQSTTSPLFDKMRHAIEMRIDYFAIQCGTEVRLIENFESFFTILRQTKPTNIQEERPRSIQNK